MVGLASGPSKRLHQSDVDLLGLLRTIAAAMDALRHFALSGQPTAPTASAHIRVFAPAGGGDFAKDLMPAYEADLMVERPTCGESVREIRILKIFVFK
jgi:hypothetical protein